ncbi:MAG TPA: ankyrin repeat domain-containing protein [Vicinamibacterales bacterium]|nr:ankyrin repeat domain-containing protein [Vicinamibacterales bacterium]
MRTAALVLMLSAALAAAPGGGSPVADASMRGDKEAVRSLLKQGADANGARGDGMTALHFAAQRGDADLAAMLLYAGANVSAVTRIGSYTPLHIAAQSGSASVAEALINAGADVKARTSTTGVTPLHLAAEAGSVAVIDVLVAHGAEINAREAEWGQTPLIFAAANNRVDAIKSLLAKGADPKIASKSIDVAHELQLDRAALALQKKILETTVPKGEQPTAAQLQAAIHAARELLASGKIPPKDPGPADDSLRQGFDPEEINPPVAAKGGLTALLHAARQGYIDSAKALLDGGAPIDQASAGDGTTPLVMAAINGQFDMATFLVERGANPNIAAKENGVTPLWAVINTEWQPRTRFPQPEAMEYQKATYLDVMKALLDHGADPNARIKSHPWYLVYSGCGNRNCGLADTSGSTAFWRAAYGTDVEAMKLLVSYGADPNIPSMAPARPVRRGGPPQGGGPGVDGTNAPVANPAPPVPYGGPGAWALHAAAGLEYGEGFAGNAHRHAPGGFMPAVKYLVEELGADVNARDNDGYTALHHAAARGDNEMIMYLVSKGADVTAVARSGQTVADMANGPVQRISPFPETVALLEKLGSKNSHRCVSC